MNTQFFENLDYNDIISQQKEFLIFEDVDQIFRFIKEKKGKLKLKKGDNFMILEIFSIS